MRLTTTPPGVAGDVHDRMPVILPEEARRAWLDTEARYREVAPALPSIVLPVPGGR